MLGAFDLDAEEAAEVVDGEVVGGVVSPGAGDEESELGGAGHERSRPFAACFGVGDVEWFLWHFGLLGRKLHDFNLFRSGHFDFRAFQLPGCGSVLTRFKRDASARW